jgi:23S rRNA-/tRNA-specific pseudouridylate synthase
MEKIRVSKWLQTKYPNLTQRQREEALDAKLVTYGSGGLVRKGDKLGPEEVLDCLKLDSHIDHLKNGEDVLGVKVVAEAAEFIVVDKPAGVVCHPISLFDVNTLTQWARFKYPQVSKEFPEPQPTLTPHRLDTGTSGVVIVSLNRSGFSDWRNKFKNKLVTKKYLAWCWGYPEKESYSVECSIAHAVGTSGKMVALKGSVKHQPPILEAVSRVVVRRRLEEKGVFLAEVECHTGVTHQVRVHLACIGFPLIGDSLYDVHSAARPIQRKYHALRATQLSCHGWSVTAPSKNFENEYQ